MNNSVALSSALYTIASSSFARLKNAVKKPPAWRWLIPLDLIWCLLTWLPLGGLCFVGALRYCTRTYWLKECLSPEQLDVCQTIFRRWHLTKRAEECINLALKKQSQNPHTTGLLWVAKAEMYALEKDCDNATLRSYLKNAWECAGQAKMNEPMQAARIYRLCAEIINKTHEPTDAVKKFTGQLLGESMRLSLESGAKDQLAKLPQ